MQSIGTKENNLSLVALAEVKKLPLHQYMDIETIEWISEHNPFNNLTLNIPPLSIDDLVLLGNYYPPQEWFLASESVKGIHGIRHLMRVGLFCIILVRVMRLAPDLKNLITSAVLHDIRREHDKDDHGHGERAGRWFLNNIETIESQFNVSYSEQDKAEIYWAMCYHDLDHVDFQDGQEYAKHSGIVDCLRAADALDRYRLPKLKWWFNPEMVRLNVGVDIMHFAYQVVLNSERQHLKTPNRIGVIIDCFAQELCLSMKK